MPQSISLETLIIFLLFGSLFVWAGLDMWRQTRILKRFFSAIENNNFGKVKDIFGQRRFFGFRKGFLIQAFKMAKKYKHKEMAAFLGNEYLMLDKVRSSLATSIDDLPTVFPRRPMVLMANSIWSIVVLGLAIYFAANEMISFAVETTALLAALYLLIAYLRGYDLTTRFTREGKVIHRSSLLPFLNSSFDLKGASEYLQVNTVSELAFTTTLYIYAHSGKQLGVFPVSAFEFRVLELWAAEYLVDRRG